MKNQNKSSSSFSSIPGKMPVLFVGHGSPMNAAEENSFVEGFRKIGHAISEPAAILCISAHWETSGTHVTAMDRPRTIHDFGGFPRILYEIQYPAPGHPGLAKQIRGMVKKAQVELNYNWGLDHGAWTVIKHLYPEADVPVVQMSLDHDKPPQYHYDLAGELFSLRKEGILIIGSGNIVHNLRLVAWDRMNDHFGYDWALEANEKIKKFILDNDHVSLIGYHLHGRSFQLAIPTPEHYLPLLYAMALKDKNDVVTLFNDEPLAGSLTMTSLKIDAEM